jgi:hypothetical protein
MVRWIALAVTLAGCKKEVVDTGPSGSCDDITTTPVSSVPATDYPDGLTDQLPAWRDLPGIYTADYCGRGEVEVKLDNMPIAEEIGLVTNEVDDRLGCGCTTDPDFTDSDNALGAHAYSEGTFFLFDNDSELDPGVVEAPINGKLVNITWALMPADAPIAMRGCANDVPVTDNTGTFQTASVVIRVSPGGTQPSSGTVTLTGEDESLACELTTFVFKAENGA